MISSGGLPDNIAASPSTKGSNSSATSLVTVTRIRTVASSDSSASSMSAVAQVSYWPQTRSAASSSLAASSTSVAVGTTASKSIAASTSALESSAAATIKLERITMWLVAWGLVMVFSSNRHELPSLRQLT